MPRSAGIGRSQPLSQNSVGRLKRRRRNPRRRRSGRAGITDMRLILREGPTKVARRRPRFRLRSAPAGRHVTFVVCADAGMALASPSAMSSPGKECRLREHLRILLEEAACAAERRASDPLGEEVRVTSDVIRLARLATSMHQAEAVAARAHGFRHDHLTPRREIHR